MDKLIAAEGQVVAPVQGTTLVPRADPFRPSRIRWSALALLFLSLLILFVSEDRKIDLYDEGIILTGADSVSSGAAVHRDFYFVYGPAQLQIVSFLFKVFSPSVLVERCWDALVRSTAVVLVFLLCIRLRSELAAWMAAIASLIWLARLDFHGYPVFPVLVVALAGVVCLLPVFERSRSGYRLFAAGICAGITVLFRYEMGVAVFAVEAAVLGVYFLSEAQKTGRTRLTALLPLLPFASGLALIVLPLATAYVASGVTNDFLFDIVSFPSRYYVATRSLPFPGLHTLKWSPVQTGDYLPLVAMAATLPALYDRWRRKEDGLKLWLPLTLLALTLVFFAKGFVRVSVLHMGMAIVSSLALLAALTVDFWYRPLLVRLAVGGAVAFAVLCTLFAGYGDMNRSRQNLAALVHHGGCPTPSELRFGCYTLEEPELSAVRYIERMTTPADYLFVGAGRHDKAFTNDVVFYFLTGRRPATKFYQFDPGLQTTAPRQSQIVAELSDKKPPYIVLDSQWDDSKEPNHSRDSSGVVVLDNYLHSHFTPVAKFGTVSILKNVL
jgi:hypothetical protein